MKKIIVLVFVIFLFLVTLKSQNPISSKHQHFIGISSGISQMLIQDETVSPFIYEGVRMPLEISYRYNSPNCRQLLFVNYFSSTLTSLISNKLNNLNYYEENQNLSIEYSYSRKVYTLSKHNTDFFLGGEIGSMTNFRQHHFVFYNNDPNTAPVMDQINSISVNFLIEKKFANHGKDILCLKINTPIISYTLMNNMYNSNVGKSLDKIDTNENMSSIIWQVIKSGDLVTMNELMAVRAELSYVRVLSPTIGLELKYSLNYYSQNKYTDLFKSRCLNNQYLVGLIVKI